MPYPEKIQKRQTAYKIRIKDILISKYTKTDGFAPNYFGINGKEISRINVIGVVVQISELDNYKTLTVEDGTGSISARAFEYNVFLEKINIGDIVLIIGRPREFSSEKYILIEIIKKIDPMWARVRELELEKNKIEDNISSNNYSSKEKGVFSKPMSKIVKLIKELDKGNGVPIEDLSGKSIRDMDKIIALLLKEGDIFEIRPGKLKVLE